MDFELDTDQITALFTREDGAYLFARWSRPIAPVAFGITEPTLSVLKGAIEATCQLAGHDMAETDPELGANLMVFFIRDWQELVDTPNLDRMIPELAKLVERLKRAKANQYRIFRFDEEGGIKACFVFLRMDEILSKIAADNLCLSQVVQSILLWSDTAFLNKSPLIVSEDGVVCLRPDIAGVIAAAYDPAMPPMAKDASHALRLAARVVKARDRLN